MVGQIDQSSALALDARMCVTPQTIIEVPRALVFGRRIKMKRAEQGRKAKDVAKDAGIDATYLSRIEHGRVWPTRPVRVALAHILKVDLDDLERPEDQQIA